MTISRPAPLNEASILALERTLTVRAFRSLPPRWRDVLRLTEVDNVPPRLAAPQLELTANATAALAYRARRGLKRAWIGLNLDDDSTPAECRAGIARLASPGGNRLSSSERDAITVHLAVCPRCLIVSEELRDIGSKLALVLRPLLH